MLADCSSGKMRTLAGCRRRLHGKLSCRICSKTAVSACISPSISSSGSRRETISTARRTLRAAGGVLEPKFEKESMATRGTTLKRRGEGPGGGGGAPPPPRGGGGVAGG